MKIDSGNNKIQVEPPKQGGSTAPAEKGDRTSFGSVLKNELQTSSQNSVAQAKNALPPQPVAPFSPTFHSQPSRTESVKKVENLLFSLEMYKSSLGNTKIKLPGLEDLIKGMKEESEEAVKSAALFPENDPLKNIISEVALLVNQESRRYYSGANT